MPCRVALYYGGQEVGRNLERSATLFSSKAVRPGFTRGCGRSSGRVIFLGKVFPRTWSGPGRFSKPPAMGPLCGRGGFNVGIMHPAGTIATPKNEALAQTRFLAGMRSRRSKGVRGAGNGLAPTVGK